MALTTGTAPLQTTPKSPMSVLASLAGIGIAGLAACLIKRR
jgi:hypothetical protein